MMFKNIFGAAIMAKSMLDHVPEESVINEKRISTEQSYRDIYHPVCNPKEKGFVCVRALITICHSAAVTAELKG